MRAPLKEDALVWVSSDSSTYQGNLYWSGSVFVLAWYGRYLSGNKESADVWFNDSAAIEPFFTNVKLVRSVMFDGRAQSSGVIILSEACVLLSNKMHEDCEKWFAAQDPSELRESLRRLVIEPDYQKIK